MPLSARMTDRSDFMQVLVFIKDQERLFERLAAYFYEQQINVHEAQIHTSSNGYALDSFTRCKSSLRRNRWAFCPA